MTGSYVNSAFAQEGVDRCFDAESATEVVVAFIDIVVVAKSTPENYAIPAYKGIDAVVFVSAILICQTAPEGCRSADAIGDLGRL